MPIFRPPVTRVEAALVTSLSATQSTPEHENASSNPSSLSQDIPLDDDLPPDTLDIECEEQECEAPTATDGINKLRYRVFASSLVMFSDRGDGGENPMNSKAGLFHCPVEWQT